MSLNLDGRENKIKLISDTMTGFYAVMRNLQEDYATYHQNYSEEALALLSRSGDFIESVEAVRSLDSLSRIDDEGINELFLLSQQIAELYHLKVQTKIEDEKPKTLPKKIKSEKSFWNTLWGALQGEYNESPTGMEILIDMGINFIPFVGQACDVRDITACLKKLVIERRVNEVMIWVTLLLTAIGCVPYAGDVIKAGCKAIIKGADDAVLTVLRKLDADDVQRAFKMLRSKFTSSIEDATAMVNKWIEKAGNSKYGSKVNEILAGANENLKKASDFVSNKIDEFEEKVFGKGKKSRLKKNNSETPKIENLGSKEFTTEPFEKDGKLKKNIRYKTGEYDYFYETDELGRINLCETKELHIKNHEGRLSHNSATPGKLEDDHAGHLIADMFGGSPELDNLVSQAKVVNQKEYRKIERDWQNALAPKPTKKKPNPKTQKVTDIKIEIIYDVDNVRPKEFRIEYCIDGKPYTPDPIPNI
ncbi:DNA/RNA non-specific endonuclease [Treponema sp.]|uniref:DNA/RNA non-specific endonuclease n=1 Tax=Treponema sp. TaxID=166 RepID=UPI00298E2DD2|nr:DNA/RNA non-specific endonuclease [Treponema sp.]